MKYTKHIVFLLFINLIIGFLFIFFGNFTRKLEITNNSILNNIEHYKEQLKINKIEFSFYNNPDYLKKLHDIYFSLEERNLESKIVSISNISNNTDYSLLLVNLKSD